MENIRSGEISRLETIRQKLFPVEKVEGKYIRKSIYAVKICNLSHVNLKREKEKDTIHN